MTKSKVTVVEETNKGVYVWYTSDGKLVQDSDGNVMNIPATKGDMDKVRQLKEAARSFGVPDGGRAVFLSGQRRVSDEEYEYQKQREEWGLIPDELDIPAMQDEMRFREQRKKNGES